MKRRNIIWVIVFAFLMPVVHGQVVESKKVYIKLNPAKDNSPPQIKVLSPTFPENNTILSMEDHMDFVVEVADENKIDYLQVGRDLKVPDNPGVSLHTVWLDPGMNRIEVKSADEFGQVTELTYWITYEPPLILLEDRIRESTTYYGIVIGINEYQDERINDLVYPIADALSLRECLIENYSFKKENVTLMENPTRADIINELDALRDVVTPSDNLLIFYAGHGQYDEKAEIGYWLPSDATLSSKVDWLRNNTLVDLIQSIDSKHTLLITDACFSGSIFTSRSLSMETERAYDRIYDLGSRKAMTSGAMTEVPDKSIFVRYLIRSLKENDASCLSAEDLFYSFNKKVVSSSTNINRPRYGDIRVKGNEGGDFIFLRRMQ